LLFKKSSQATWSTKTLCKISKKIATFGEKESYEIAKIFGGFGQFFLAFFSFEIIILC